MFADPNMRSEFFRMLLSIESAFADILNIRGLLPFSGVTFMVLLA